MIEFAIALALAQKPGWGVHTPVDYSLLSDEWHCEQLEGLIPDVRRHLPEMIDATTREDGMSLNCETRTVTMERSIVTEISEMGEVWRAGRQAQWNDEICPDRILGVLARRGWRIRQNLSLQSGEHVSMDADCPRS